MAAFVDFVIETQRIIFTTQAEQTVVFTSLPKQPRVVATPISNDVNIFIKNLSRLGCTLVASTAITGIVHVTAIVKM